MKKQPEANTAKVETVCNGVASQGVRRTTEDATPLQTPPEKPSPDMEVVALAKRRRFSLADKLRILKAADLCTIPGEIGALLRKEGIYSSSLSSWRHQRNAAQVASLAAKKRGPKPDEQHATLQQVAKLTQTNAHLQSQLDKALLVIDVQKKVSMLLGLMPMTGLCGST